MEAVLAIGRDKRIKFIKKKNRYVQICEELLQKEEIFDAHFMTNFLAIQKDKILNVRITLAKVLKFHLDCHGINI